MKVKGSEIKMERINAIKERLDADDQIGKTFGAQYEKKRGSIMMSKKKFFFVEEKGFLKKTYNLVLELPYEKVKNVSPEGDNGLVITELEGRKHTFRTDVIYENVTIEKNFNDLIHR